MVEECQLDGIIETPAPGHSRLRMELRAGRLSELIRQVKAYTSDGRTEGWTDTDTHTHTHTHINKHSH